MVLSRWPYPPGRERATLSRCLISSGVRYSRGRTAALVERRGVIVRFSMIGPPFTFTRKPLWYMGPVYPIVRIWAINGTTGMRINNGANEGAVNRNHHRMLIAIHRLYI